METFFFAMTLSTMKLVDKEIQNKGKIEKKKKIKINEKSKQFLIFERIFRFKKKAAIE